MKYNIPKIYYIQNISITPKCVDNIEDDPLKQCDAFRAEIKNILSEFISIISDRLGDHFIMLRMGFDNTAENNGDNKLHKLLLIQEYITAREIGFENVNILTHLKFSRTFVLRNSVSKEFLDSVFRMEAVNWLFDNDDNCIDYIDKSTCKLSQDIIDTLVDIRSKDGLIS
jgi:hypothetical protein